MIFFIILETRGILDPGLIESRAMLVRGMITYGQNNLPVISSAANMAHHGMLGPVQEMRLCEVDLTSVSAEGLASLASCVTDCVQIENVRGCGLVTFLDSVKSNQLTISSKSLGSEETRALVRAMESRVEKVHLHGEVKLDISLLIEYSGKGKCGELEGFEEESLTTLARCRNWKVIVPSYPYHRSFRSFAIKRN